MKNEEIISLYENGLSIRQVAEKCPHSASKVRKILLENDVMRTSKEGLRLIKLNDIPISDELAQVIEGEMLGDGCIKKRVAQSYFSFNNNNPDYSKWLALKFVDNGIKLTGNGVRNKTYFHKNWNKWFTTHSFSTISTKQLHELENKWYENRTKILPKDVELSPLSVLHWYIGDGSLPNGQYIIFCTDNFSRKEVEELSSKLNEILNIESIPFKYGKYNRIFLSKRSAEKLLHYIGPPPFNSIEYKWNLMKFGKTNDLLDIDKNELYDLYINRNFSRKQIAKLYGCSKELIEKKIRIFSLYKRESNNIIDINRDELSDLYINKKLTQGNLAEHFKCSIFTIRNRLRNFGIRKKNKWVNNEG